MKIRTKLILGGLAAALVAAGINGYTRKTPGQSELQVLAKVSKKQAQQAALTKVPDGVVQASELKNERGELVWSVDISKADSEGVAEEVLEATLDAMTGGPMETSTSGSATEVAVNALTGNIISVSVEKKTSE